MRFQREWLGLALVVLGLARAALLVAHEPLVGYANQYDMHRTGACVGLFPATPAPGRYESSPEAPLPIYRSEAPRADGCYPSTEVAVDEAVVAVAQAAHATANGVRLQWIGYTKLAILALTALVLAWSLHRHPDAALLHGLVVFLVVCDPVATLWFNTLYTEFAAIWGIYAAIGAIAALALTSRGAYGLAPILVAALVALAFSREQFALLAPALAIVGFPWLWYRSPHLAVAAFGAALVSSVISFALIPRPGDVHRGNRVDTYLGLVLPAATSPLRALASLGLPARCEPAIGVTWYLRRGENLDELCPEAYKLDSLAFLRLARSDSDALSRSVARVLPATQELAPALGTMAGDRRVLVNELAPWLRSPLHALVWRLPALAYACVIVAVMAALPLALLAALAWARPSREEEGVPLLLAMMLSGTVAYTLLTTVFGDGLSESARHFLPGSLAAVAALIALAVAVPATAGRWWGEPRSHGMPIAAALASVLVIALTAGLALRWARDQPLALGVLDQPGARALRPGADLTLIGWALDPFGVDEVIVDLGGLRTVVPHNAASPGLKPVFPGYPDSDHAIFNATLSAQDVARASVTGPPTLRVLVKSRTGATTEIDRRRLEPTS